MKIQLTDSARSAAVSAGLLGGNTLFQIDAMSTGIEEKLSSLGVSQIRWPGGSIAEGWFDPANPDTPLSVPRRPEQSLDPNHLLTFSEVIKMAADTNRALSIVLPSIHILQPASESGSRAIDETAVAEIKEFVKQCLGAGGRYADATIASFEIGNEYWSCMTSKEYGRVSNVLLKAVSEAIEESGTVQIPKILVQVGEGWGPDFEPGGEYYDKGLTWGGIQERANQDIIDQLDPQARLLVGGLIEHFYTTNGGNLDFSDTVVWSAEKRQAIWSQNGLVLDQHMTEWNLSMHGLKSGQPVFASGAGMLESFEYLVRMGAKSAFVWPLTQGTSNDLTGNSSAGAGHLSANGAAFTLMSHNVVGLSWQELNIEDHSAVESSCYVGANKAVVFLSSNDGKPLDERVDISGLAPAGSRGIQVTQTFIVRDPTQDRWVGAGSGAAIISGGTGNSTSVSISLQPYEIVMITMQWKEPTVPIPHSNSYLGGSSDDVIFGEIGGDVIRAAGGSDRVYGQGGDDSCFGGNGNDLIFGQDGHDRLWGDDGRDTLNGGTGDDHLWGGLGADLLIGGSGNDRLMGGKYQDTLVGGSGDDYLSGDQDNDRLTGGDGNDTLIGGDGENTLVGERGNDRIIGGDNRDMLSGGAGNDALNGGAGNDWLSGGEGCDTLSGGVGNDAMDGGNGNDWQQGESGNDNIKDNLGSDTLKGGLGNDTLRSGADRDFLYGESGDDNLFGGSGTDLLSGGFGQDRLFGDSGSDSLRGGSGNDSLYGGAGNDLLTGGYGDDILRGDSGNDTLYFGSKAAVEGGAGSDIAYGGSGCDTFVFNGASGFVEIRDFEQGKDRISFMHSDVDLFSDIEIRDTVRNQVVISFDGGTIRIDHASATQFTDTDFIF